MAINHIAIIRQYQVDPTAHRRLQQDAVARMEQEQKAGNFASELRRSVRFPGATRCKFCKSADVRVLSKSLECKRCGKTTWRWP